MKLIAALLLLTSLAQANEHLSMKERVRAHLWVYGIKKPAKVKTASKPLPEELERALKKI